MPNPGKKENKEEFINRCMSELVGTEGKDKSQAYAICISKWENKNMANVKMEIDNKNYENRKSKNN